jgi:hypothetical protein
VQLPQRTLRSRLIMLCKHPKKTLSRNRERG